MSFSEKTEKARPVLFLVKTGRRYADYNTRYNEVYSANLSAYPDPNEDLEDE